MKRGIQTELARTKSTSGYNDDNERQCDGNINKRLDNLEKESKEIRNIIDELKEMIFAVQSSMIEGTTDSKPVYVPIEPVCIARHLAFTKSKQGESHQKQQHYNEMNMGKLVVCVDVSQTNMSTSFNIYHH